MAADKPEPLATPEDVAAFLGVPAHTLAQWRSQRKGPRYCRVGRHVRYRWSAVNGWVDQQEKAGTTA